MAHDHSNAPMVPTDLGPAFRWAVGMNTAYVVIEATAGLLTGSLALLADAAHNVTDVAGLLVAWGAAVLAKRASSMRHTWGLGRATIMAAMLNAFAILVGVGAVIWEASSRFQEDIELPGGTILVVALVGIGVNAGSALLFMKGKKGDLNAKGAFLHLATDAAVSGAVVVAALGMMLTGWTWLDPAVAIAVSVLIAFSAAGLLRESIHLNLDGVPNSIEPIAVEQWLLRQGVTDVHDLHIWPISTSRAALTVHLVWQGEDTDSLICHLAEELAEDFGIEHATIQVERRACDRACARGVVGTTSNGPEKAPPRQPGAS